MAWRRGKKSWISSVGEGEEIGVDARHRRHACGLTEGATTEVARERRQEEASAQQGCRAWC
jgi:hypothetical protein